MIASYSKYYLVAQILPGCILAIAVEVIALKDLNAEEELLNLDVDLLNWSIFTGLFCNLAYCFNFFVYYINSKEYRAIFDDLLGIGHVKALLCRRKKIGDQQVASLPIARPSNHVTVTHRI
ncbi:unnamed protein product [Haemonchus placei]|uniref:BTP domain-containing protein n=1 Tax=Haemonchus placei TaxID=6290 RepID=A0A0N4X0I1_HAEPC|nr:unnamed protein product [Haemonchus placei]